MSHLEQNEEMNFKSRVENINGSSEEEIQEEPVNSPEMSPCDEESIAAKFYRIFIQKYLETDSSQP